MTFQPLNPLECFLCVGPFSGYKVGSVYLSHRRQRVWWMLGPHYCQHRAIGLIDHAATSPFFFILAFMTISRQYSCSSYRISHAGQFVSILNIMWHISWIIFKWFVTRYYLPFRDKLLSQSWNRGISFLPNSFAYIAI